MDESENASFAETAGVDDPNQYHVEELEHAEDPAEDTSVREKDLSYWKSTSKSNEYEFHSNVMFDGLDSIPSNQVFGRVSLLQADNTVIAGAILPYEHFEDVKAELLAQVARIPGFNYGIVEFMVDSADNEPKPGYTFEVVYIRADLIIGISVEMFRWEVDRTGIPYGSPHPIPTIRTMNSNNN